MSTNFPRKDDAVLGGSDPDLSGDMVLGGLLGLFPLIFTLLSLHVASRRIDFFNW